MNYPENLSASDQRWLDLIQQCRTSGKSDKQWLEENNIKSPTFYYHVKQLRKKACDIPKPVRADRNDIQAVIPLCVEEPTSVVPTRLCDNAVNDAIAVRLTVKGVSVEIANNATQDVIKNTLAALQFLC